MTVSPPARRDAFLGRDVAYAGFVTFPEPSAVESLSYSPHSNVLKDTYDYIWY